MPAISSNREAPVPTQAEIDRRRGRFVPWVIAAFYMTFMSALIGFVVIAYQHPPNAVTAEAYEKGLAYNATLAEGTAQDRLGWSTRIDYVGDRLSVQLLDASGRPIEGARVRAWFVRPAQSALDRTVDLSGGAKGAYGATLALPAAGDWEVHVTAAANGHQFQSSASIEADAR